jgi:hypothetical protein
MSKFKVGDEIVRAKEFAPHAPEGYASKVINGYRYIDKDGGKFHILDSQWELAKPKWTIYNNTLPWSDLSDKQKGKMLLAAHNGTKFCGFGLDGIPVFNLPNEVYKANPVKPDSAMAELFWDDWQDCECSLQKAIDYMIFIGWAKKC